MYWVDDSNSKYYNKLVNITINDEETVHAICRLLQQGYSNSKIAYRLNISPELVRSIKKGAHRHISQFYDSAKRKYVYSMFKEKFLMADDIAWIMTD